MLRLFKKRRKYPIIRDDHGMTLRTRCFQLFWQGKRPAQISRELGAKPRTVLTYFSQWKKQPPKLEEDYPIFKARLKKNPKLKQKIARGLAKELYISEDEAIERLEKPWAIKQAVRRTWQEEKKQKDGKLRFEAAQRIVTLVEKTGFTLPQIIRKLGELVEDKNKAKA